MDASAKHELWKLIAVESWVWMRVRSTSYDSCVVSGNEGVDASAKHELRFMQMR